MKLRRILLITPFFVIAVAGAAWYWALHTEAGARWVWTQAVAATGGALAADEISGDLHSGITVARFRYLSGGTDIGIAEAALAIDVDIMPLRVTASAATASQARIAVTRAADGNPASLHDTLAKLRLPLEIVVATLAVDRLDFAADGETVLSVDNGSLAGRWKDDIRVEQFEAVMPGMNIAAHGRLALEEGHDVEAAVKLALEPGLTGLDDTLTITADILGPLDELRFEARTDDPRGEFRGRLIDLDTSLRWELEADVPAFILPEREGIPTVPAIGVVARGRGDLQSLTVDAELGLTGTDARAGLSADVDLRAATVTGNLDWDNVIWPPSDAEPRFRSRRGEVRLSGTLDDWSVAGTIALHVAALPPGTFRIDGSGDRDHAVIDVLDSDVLGGSVAGRTEYSWRGTRAFAARLDLADIRTADIFPQWPAIVSGGLELRGQQTPLRLSARLSNVRGDVLGRPLRADGRIEFDGDTLFADGLSLQHGESTADINGHPSTGDGLRFDVFVDDLARYAETAFGSIRARGAVLLGNGNEFVRVEATADMLGYRGIRVGQLRVRNANEPGGILDVVVTAGEIEAYGIRASDAQLLATLGREQQAFDLDVTIDGLGVAASVAGALDDWDRPTTWTGELSRFDIRHPTLSAALSGPAELHLARGRMSLEGYCLDGAAGFSLCAAAFWSAGGESRASADIVALPLDLVNAFATTNFEFDQVISGALDWQIPAGGRSSGRADLRMAAGTIRGKNDPDVSFATGASTIGFDVRGKSLRGGIVDIPLPGLGQIQSNFELREAPDRSSHDLRGEVDIDLADVGVLMPLVPVVDDASGSLRADLDLAGTLAAPSITGHLSLTRGSLSYLPIGLRLQEIELQSELEESGEIELAGSFRAGEGHARIRTRADHAQTATRGLELTLVGEDLTVIDVPDVLAVADTDVRVNFDGRTLGLNGKVAVARARVTPEHIGTARVWESDDVVVIAGELPGADTMSEKKSDLRIAGELDVTLGRDVVFDLGVAQTRVDGSTRLTWGGDPMPVANGQFSVNGEILAFGQRLEIAEGSVGFPNVPANDPYLRIRAEREIFGNTQVRRAGVLVAGSASRPTIEAYTIPLTTEERALTLLVTGSDFNFDKGVGALGFGTYIAPRVYASYGIGLFDRDNVVRLRYDLARGFGITGTSGQRESGVDLSYRFEN